MTLRKVLKFISGLLLLLAATIALTSINHPIILKWVTGSARHFGRPASATVYTNGKENDGVKVFYTDEPDNYLLSLAEYGSSGTFKFVNIDLEEKVISRPVATSADDYDFIAGHLFQSKAGAQLTPLENDMNGSAFDSKLSFVNEEIKFSLPPNELKIDSIRIKLD